ncbi:hypothetical protein HYFRA_00012071, partial [Hymenoscyphus fraxineus]
GRGPYEPEVVESSSGEASSSSSSSNPRQLYNDHGRPRNPETKRREREHVRAANEVMQVTGVVEDSIAARVQATEILFKKNRDTLTGIRAMEWGRALMVGGIWGVLGLRRRILLYRSSAHLGLFQFIRRDVNQNGLLWLLTAGLPAVVAYHVADWIEFFAETILDAIWEEEDENGDAVELSPGQANLKGGLKHVINISHAYVTLHLRMFGILQQLNLIPYSQILPAPTSFIPFSTYSPLRITAFAWPASIFGWRGAVVASMAPLLATLVHGKLKYIAARLTYQHIYTLLPRPTGDSMFAGLSIEPSAEYDTPDQPTRDRSTSQDEQTLRALEGLSSVEQREPRSRTNDRDSDSGHDEDGEIPHATLISFDVEAAEAVESPLGTIGTWSAELRSANEPRESNDTKYRITGLTLLPAIMATEGLREIVAGIIVMPFEAFMVRVLGHAIRASAGSSTKDMYPSLFTFPLGLGMTGAGNIAAVLMLQLSVTGVVWAGFTVGSQRWTTRRNAELEAKERDV